MMIILTVLAVLVLATLDAHPKSQGVAPSLWTKAKYPKVGVHFLGGGYLFALLASHIYNLFVLMLAVAALAMAYEGIQWLNPIAYYFKRDEGILRERGVFSLADAAAAVLGALVIVFSLILAGSR